MLEPDDVASDLVVGRHGDWVVWVPEAPTWPYELRLAPRSDAPDLVDERCDRDGLAAALVAADQLFRLHPAEPSEAREQPRVTRASETSRPAVFIGGAVYSQASAGGNRFFGRFGPLRGLSRA